MTHDDPRAPADPAHAPAHHGAPPGEQTYFPPDEWQQFRNADWTAAAYIVVLMQGIFLTGVVLYLIVLWSVV